MRLLKSIKKSLIALLAVVMTFSAIPFSGVLSNYFITPAAAANNEDIIFKYLVDEMGLNSAAACGVLANIECESSFNPNLSGDNGASYGICQWNGSRFTQLKDYCQANGYQYDTIEGQLKYLQYELTNNPSDTGNILKKLNVENTEDGAYQAGYDWCYYFERPYNKAVKAVNRGNLAKDDYWPVYKIEFLVTEYKIADVDSNNEINSNDALLVIQYSVGSVELTDIQLKAADVNGNGIVNSEDALIILNISIGNIVLEDDTL